MSWHVCFIGKPENLVTALEKESERLTDQSKKEFDSALPHLTALLKENFSTNQCNLRITANGHGYAKDGTEVHRQCFVNIESVPGIVV